MLDFDAVPVGGADSEGPRERKPNPAWRLDHRGVLSDSHGELLSRNGLGGMDRRADPVHHRGRACRPKSAISQSPPTSPGCCTRGTPQGAHLALITEKGQDAAHRPGVNPQGAAGNGVAGVRLAKDDDEVIAAVPLTGSPDEAILSVSAKGWKRSPPALTSVKAAVAAGRIPPLCRQ